MEEIRQEKPFKIQGIELISFLVQPQQARGEYKDTLEFTIQQEPKTNPEKRLIIVFTTVIIRETGKETFLANLQVACGFEFPSFEKLIRKHNHGDFLIPHDLNLAVSKISISIVRGVLYSQLRGSYLQNTVLPMLSFE